MKNKVSQDRVLIKEIEKNHALEDVNLSKLHNWLSGSAD